MSVIRQEEDESEAVRPKMPFGEELLPGWEIDSLKEEEKAEEQKGEVGTALADFIVDEVREIDLAKALEFKFSLIDESLLSMKKEVNHKVKLVYYLGFMATMLFRVYRLAELVVVIIASFLLSIDYPFRMELLGIMYKSYFPVIWFFSGLGFFFLSWLLAHGFQMLLPPMKQRYNFLKQELGTYYLTKLVSNILRNKVLVSKYGLTISLRVFMLKNMDNFLATLL
jgi:hypothetical protein